MTLSSMVVSRDWQEVSVLECILGALHIDVSIENQPQRALARLNKSKVDALIVDCDLSGTTQFLREVQRDQRGTNPVPLVIMGGSRSRNNLDATGALFAFEKPISVEQAVRTLSAARNLILDGRLRYHRAGLEVPVSLSCSPREQVEGQLINVSQGGLQIHTDDPVEMKKTMRVSFELPGAKCGLKAQAEIAWQDKRGNIGIRFVKVAPRQQRTLQLWLAQQYFAN
jgi:CheY-like chemotaxis protein